MRKVIALQDGFYAGGRIRKGQKFKVSDGAKGRWFVDEDKYKEPEPLPDFDSSRQGVKRESRSFVALMKQPVTGEESPDTLSGLARKAGRPKHEDSLLGKK